MSKVILTIEGDDLADVGLQVFGIWEALNRRPEPSTVPVAVPAQSTAPEPVPAATGAIPEGPRGQCPKHLKPWKEGSRGLFCSAKDESGFNGYCSLTPGDVYMGKRAAA